MDNEQIKLAFKLGYEQGLKKLAQAGLGPDFSITQGLMPSAPVHYSVSTPKINPSFVPNYFKRHTHSLVNPINVAMRKTRTVTAPRTMENPPPPAPIFEPEPYAQPAQSVPTVAGNSAPAAAKVPAAAQKKMVVDYRDRPENQGGLFRRWLPSARRRVANPRMIDISNPGNASDAVVW